MQLQKQPKATLSIRILVVATLALATWLHPMDAKGMGWGFRIDGPLLFTIFGWPDGKCVREGATRTGLGVQAISYTGGHLQCDMFGGVNDLLIDQSWCSTWVIPNSPNECRVGDSGSRGGAKRCPILLDLDRNQFHLSGGKVDFDLDSDGQPESVTWVSPGTRDAFLYLDLNGNGLVDDGSELFGDATLLMSGEQAEHGYEALAEFDLVENGGNQDGVIDHADSIFADLKVWLDGNANGVHENSESMSLAEAGVLSLGLDYKESPRLDKYGNEFRYLGRGMIEVNGSPKSMRTTDVFFRVLGE
jgi:hypothetical protein